MWNGPVNFFSLFLRKNFPGIQIKEKKAVFRTQKSKLSPKHSSDVKGLHVIFKREELFLFDIWHTLNKIRLLWKETSFSLIISLKIQENFTDTFFFIK